MIILTNKHFLSKNFEGISLWPFLIIKDNSFKQKPSFLNHEKIHLRQQLEMALVFFYLWYAIEFIFRWFYYKNALRAYANISFEREAYTRENQLDYLNHRNYWSFLRYL